MTDVPEESVLIPILAHGQDLVVSLALPPEAIPGASWATVQPPQDDDTFVSQGLKAQFGSLPGSLEHLPDSAAIGRAFHELNESWLLSENMDTNSDPAKFVSARPAEKFARLSNITEIGGLIIVATLVTDVSDAGETLLSAPFVMVTGAPSVPIHNSATVGFDLQDLQLSPVQPLMPLGTTWNSTKVFPIMVPLIRDSRSGTLPELIRNLSDNWESIWQFEHGLKACSSLLIMDETALPGPGISSKLWVPTDNTGETVIDPAPNSTTLVALARGSPNGAWLHSAIILLPINHNIPVGFCTEVSDDLSLASFIATLHRFTQDSPSLDYSWLESQWSAAWFEGTRNTPEVFARTLYSLAQIRDTISPMIRGEVLTPAQEQAFQIVYWRMTYALVRDRMEHVHLSKTANRKQANFKLYEASACKVLRATRDLPLLPDSLMFFIWLLTPPTVKAWCKDFELTGYCQQMPLFLMCKQYVPMHIDYTKDYSDIQLETAGGGPGIMNQSAASITVPPSSARTLEEAAELFRRNHGISHSLRQAVLGTPEAGVGFQLSSIQREQASQVPKNKPQRDLFGIPGHVSATTALGAILPRVPSVVSRASAFPAPDTRKDAPTQEVGSIIPQVLNCGESTSGSDYLEEIPMYRPRLSAVTAKIIPRSPWNLPHHLCGMVASTGGPLDQTWGWFELLQRSQDQEGTVAPGTPIVTSPKQFSGVSYVALAQAEAIDVLGFLGGVFLGPEAILHPAADPMKRIHPDWRYVPGSLSRHYIRAVCEQKTLPPIARHLLEESRRAATTVIYRPLQWMTPQFPDGFFDSSPQLLTGLQEAKIGDGLLYKSYTKLPDEFSIWHLIASSPENDNGRIPSNGFSAGKGMCIPLFNMIFLLSMMFECNDYENLPFPHGSAFTIANPFCGCLLQAITHLSDPFIMRAWDNMRQSDPSKGRALTIGMFYQVCLLVSHFREWCRASYKERQYCLEFIAYDPRTENSLLPKRGYVMAHSSTTTQCFSSILQDWVVETTSIFSAHSIDNTLYIRAKCFLTSAPNFLLSTLPVPAIPKRQFEDRGPCFQDRLPAGARLPAATPLPQKRQRTTGLSTNNNTTTLRPVQGGGARTLSAPVAPIPANNPATGKSQQASVPLLRWKTRDPNEQKSVGKFLFEWRSQAPSGTNRVTPKVNAHWVCFAYCTTESGGCYPKQFGQARACRQLHIDVGDASQGWTRQKLKPIQDFITDNALQEHFEFTEVANSILA